MNEHRSRRFTPTTPTTTTNHIPHNVNEHRSRRFTPTTPTTTTNHIPHNANEHRSRRFTAEAPGAATSRTLHGVNESDGAAAAGTEAGEGETWSTGMNLKGSLREAMQAPATVYEAVGGQRFFDDLVDRFYDAVEDDPLLRPMYPRNLQPSRARLAGFLSQYWGGPPHYSDERGHPRLRMRHMPFAIGVDERDAWMAHMVASLDAATIADGTGQPLPDELRAAMFDHFDNAATHLINQPPG